MMGTYLLRRLAISVPVLLGITLAVYVIISLAPGDPVDALINPEAVAALGPDFREQQREALGLNQPILVRYAIWLKEVARGNLGYSFTDRQSIAAKIGERLWPTLGLMSTALILAIVIAVPTGGVVRDQAVLVDRLQRHGARVRGDLGAVVLPVTGRDLRVRAEDPDPPGSRDADGRAAVVAVRLRCGTWPCQRSCSGSPRRRR